MRVDGEGQVLTNTRAPLDNVGLVTSEPVALPSICNAALLIIALIDRPHCLWYCYRIAQTTGLVGR